MPCDDVSDAGSANRQSQGSCSPPCPPVDALLLVKADATKHAHDATPKGQQGSRSLLAARCSGHAPGRLWHRGDKPTPLSPPQPSTMTLVVVHGSSILPVVAARAGHVADYHHLSIKYSS